MRSKNQRRREEERAGKKIAIKNKPFGERTFRIESAAGGIEPTT
jgi:hypothetical protein